MKSFYYILLLASAASCIAEFQPEWDGVHVEEKYTVHGILFADSVAKVYLGKTSSINEDVDPTGIAKAEVILSWSEDMAENLNSQSEKLTFRDSVFVGSHTLRPELYYKLEITTADGQHLSSTTTIPEHVQITHSSLLFPAGYMDTRVIKGPFGRIELNFIPPEPRTSYFEVYTYITNIHSEIPRYNIIQALNNDQLTLSEDLPSNYLYSFVFSTDGKQKEQVQLRFDNFANPFSSEFYPTLLHVSED